MATTKGFMLLAALVVLASAIPAAVTAQQCSESNPCANNKCCSKWGWCGCTDAYCGTECRGQCHPNCGARVPTTPRLPPVAGEPFIGVDYGRVANNLPSHSQVVALLRKHGVNNVKIYDANREVLQAFRGSGIKLSVAVPNEQVVAIANSQVVSDAWVANHVVEFNGFITSIGMGNEWLLDSRNDRSKLLPAMENLYRSLQKRGYSNRIKVSSSHAFDIPGFPPSEGRFRDEALMKSLLGFLQRTNSVFMLNCYPFFAHASTPQIDTDYALFRRSTALVWDHGRGYTNLFDAMVDTAISAMKRVGYPNMPIVITETGWPNGGSDRRGVGVENARTYNQNLIKHVLGKMGTPLRPGQSFPTYIFALFNEDGKSGGYQNEEKHWGHFYYNMKPIYELKMSG